MRKKVSLSMLLGIVALLALLMVGSVAAEQPAQDGDIDIDVDIDDGDIDIDIDIEPMVLV